MSETTSSTSVLRGLRPEAARRRITSFAKHFGQAHLYLAYHAAFPLALTPDLLYRLWANFPRDIHGKQLNIPWVAVADLLLSSLCDEVGHELYEMNVTLRNELLSHLKADPHFGDQRINELSDFLLTYVQQHLKSPDPNIRDFAQAQQWTALAYTKPGEAVQKLALALRSSLEQNDKAEQLRMASLIETFAEQLAGFTPLLMYAKGATHFARGEMEEAVVQFNKATGGREVVEVEQVKLRVPAQIVRKKNFFISYSNADEEWAKWIAWQLEEEAYSTTLQGWVARAGSNFVVEMNEAVQKSDHVLVVLSPDYFKSFEAHPEWIVAFSQDMLGKQRKLVPVVVRECERQLREVLGSISVINLVGLDESTARERLLINVSSKPDTPPAFPGAEAQRMPPPSSPASRGVHRSLKGVLPPTDPRTIQQREKAVKEIYARLTKPDTSAIVLTGISGVGKSTLAALVYGYAESQTRTRNDFFSAGPLWLAVDSDVTMADLAGTLFRHLDKPVPSDFDELPPQRQAQKLIELLKSTKKARLIILDQFENLLDWQTRRVIEDPGISEWLTALNSQRCRCRVLITSRPWPRGTQMYPRAYMQEYHVRGLEIEEGIELLRNQGVRGTEEELRAAVRYCAGHPFALMFLASLLKERHLSLDALFKGTTYAQLWMGNVARNLLDYIYKQQLTEVQHKILLAFSVYREPVPLDAAEVSIDLATEVPEREIRLALEVLLAQHFLQVLGEERYQPHIIVANYARRHFAENDEPANQQALRAAHARAMQYYFQQAAIKCPPRGQRQQSSDIQPLIEAIWHGCHAEQWRQAYDVMEQENIFTDLKRWGGNAALLELYQLFFPLENWRARPLEAVQIFTNLGRIYRTLGQRERAREYLNQALTICKEEADRWGEGTVLSFLGRVYADLGQKEVALRYLEQALVIRREIEDREGEGWTLDNLGEIYEDLGQVERAKDHSEQALRIREEVGDRRGIGRTFNTLARIYDNLGQKQRALEYLERALRICNDEGDRTGEALTLNRLGLFYNGLGEKELALRYYEEALHICREIGDRAGEGRTLNSLGSLYSVLEQKERAWKYLEQALEISREVGDSWGEDRALNSLGMIYDDQGKERALKYLEMALVICVRVGDRRGEGWTLHNLGRVYADLGQREQALKFFEQALHIRREVEDRRGQGWSLHNIGMLRLEQAHYELALACFLLAKAIFEDVQSPDRDLPLRYIERLQKEVGKKQFVTLLAQTELQSSLIVEQALREGL